MALLTRDRNPARLRRVGRRLARPKVKVAARRASSTVRVEAIGGDIGCLRCNGAINPASWPTKRSTPPPGSAALRLDPLVAARSVATLNAIGAAGACDD